MRFCCSVQYSIEKNMIPPEKQGRIFKQYFYKELHTSDGEDRVSRQDRSWGAGAIERKYYDKLILMGRRCDIGGKRNIQNNG